MKKYLLLFLFAICVFTQVMAQEHTIYATMGNVKNVEILKTDVLKYFGNNFQTVGFQKQETNTSFILTPTENSVRLCGENITGFPDIRGFRTIDAKNECPNMVVFTLTEDREVRKLKLPTHTNLKDVTLYNLRNLEEINFSECEGIENLVVKKLRIDDLNLTKSKLLKTLDCSNCELETLTLPENTMVNKINCIGNNLSEGEIDKLIAALPTTGGELCIECIANQVADAKEKNWRVVDAAGNDYAGIGPMYDIINVTMNKGVETSITGAQNREYFAASIYLKGCSYQKFTDGERKDSIHMKSLGRPIKFCAKKITGFPNIKNFTTIEARKRTPNMAMFTLTDDPMTKKIELPTHTVLKDVTLSNLPNLVEIDFSECEGIENLVARKLPIDELNIGKSTLLKTLDCSNCELETLVIPEKSAVNKINCSGNSLSEEEVDKLIAALPATGGELCIYDETAENNNECTAKQVADAKAKNWKVVDATGKDYAGSGAVPNSLNSIKEDSNDNAPYYDLQGRRMQKPTRSGLYIHKGKKVIIK